MDSLILFSLCAVASAWFMAYVIDAKTASDEGDDILNLAFPTNKRKAAPCSRKTFARQAYMFSLIGRMS